ncbi:tyrosine-type recombinase/integrase [Pseudomonas sp. ZT5P21]
MRVPVYPKDLIRNRGFKSLAKQLQKQWCGLTPISLADAQKALAQGLGYQNFHDLDKASKACPPDEPVPPEAIVRQAIHSALQATLQREAGLPTDQLDLERLVNDLPLTNLVAFKHVQVSPDAGQSPLLKLVSGAQSGLTKEHVQALERILKESGSLRDRALFACMLGALRKNEFLSAKMQGGAAVYGVKTVDTDINVQEAIPPSHRSTFKQYVKASRLSEGEYLFRAANAPGRPLSSDALRRICISWARKADIDVGLLTPHGIRKTTDKYADLMRLMGEKMGHRSPNSTLAYVAGLTTDIS